VESKDQAKVTATTAKGVNRLKFIENRELK
jgi:hypothetical protein